MKLKVRRITDLELGSESGVEIFDRRRTGQGKAVSRQLVHPILLRLVGRGGDIAEYCVQQIAHRYHAGHAAILVHDDRERPVAPAEAVEHVRCRFRFRYEKGFSQDPVQRSLVASQQGEIYLEEVARVQDTDDVVAVVLEHRHPGLPALTEDLYDFGTIGILRHEGDVRPRGHQILDGPVAKFEDVVDELRLHVVQGPFADRLVSQRADHVLGDDVARGAFGSDDQGGEPVGYRPHRPAQRGDQAREQVDGAALMGAGDSELDSSAIMRALERLTGEAK